MRPKFLLAATFVALLSAFVAVNRIRHPPRASHVDHLGRFEAIPIEGAVGPESFAFDPLGGGPYTGVSDGRIIKWQQDERRWINFSRTSPERDDCGGHRDHDQMEHVCGRPLGLRFDVTTGDLYIADAYMGLLVVDPSGDMPTQVATQAQGLPFGFTNGLDIDPRNGAVYFSDSSTQYQRRSYLSVIISGDKTGRLMKYDPETKQVTVLLSDLSFPNGVVLSENGDYILVAETTHCRIMRYWLETSNAGNFEVFAQLPGFPDNIHRSPRGGYWVAMHSRRGRLLEWVLAYPSMGNALLKLPFNIMKAYSYLAKWRGSGLAIRLSEQGEILEMLEDRNENNWGSVSEAKERDGTLWMGSVNMPFAGKYKI
ncbi:Strictosidine synthase 3 [Morella rubra]|uniref:Strictosidine synthase 3 n=1 Tax=Morella rubra TaxID=262757 RepID=A0A6A1WAF8_9ROSI|nr:Strictosidine synthase 3 [Morella rubra]